MSTILITGGTGLIGTAITKHLISNLHEVIVLTRTPKQSHQTGITYANWNVEEQTIDIAAVQRADYIIHLAGANVAEKRWTETRKKEILQSRTQSSALLVKALKDNSHKVQAVISASAIGWYGPDTKTSKPFTEITPSFDDYLARTCKAWEESLDDIQKLNIRLVKLRTGIVLAKEGGAMAEFMKPLKAGFATIMSTGKQVISWIHIQDLVRIYEYAMLHGEMNGIYNAVAPQPISNKELVIKLAEKMRGKMFMTINVPAIGLKIALGEMSIEVLKSTTVSANKIKDAGFKFYYPSITSALDELLKKKT